MERGNKSDRSAQTDAENRDTMRIRVGHDIPFFSKNALDRFGSGQALEKIEATVRDTEYPMSGLGLHRPMSGIQTSVAFGRRPVGQELSGHRRLIGQRRQRPFD